MKITIIGGSGFIGTALIRRLMTSKHEVTNIDKAQSRTVPEITLLANVCSREELTKAMVASDVVVLLAAEHRDDVTPTRLYYDVNVEGTQNVLDVMDSLGISNIVFTSTVAIYGLNKTNPNESMPADPFNHYGKSKWQAEEVLRAWAQKDPEKKAFGSYVRP
ncbi:NAD-dependent epimerase/dehydratase family protein [Chitinophaga horti]|uniref:NAD-dependent epimerase/dehydratase family protein n=1 Tax=Chitinophaga horti TaxID=2920382 RepID=UPI002559BF71|nr:NAD-dependent epimerase/dehydratase family protein [Chitinophaga horti]